MIRNLNNLLIFKTKLNSIYLSLILWLKLSFDVVAFWRRVYVKFIKDFFDVICYTTKNKNFYPFIKSLKKKNYILNFLSYPTTNWSLYMRHSLKITFRRRNTFFVIVDSRGHVLRTTTVRREGFFGRRRKEYLSLHTTIKEVKKLIDLLGIEVLDVDFLGVGKFRFIVKKLFKSRRKVWMFRFKTSIKILVPHNGCRPVKSKNRRKLKWKRFYKKPKKKKKRSYIF